MLSNHSIRIGCSGWQYRHWRGDFYPGDLPQARWLEYYAERFDTVEINNTFYRLPEAATFAAWGRRAPRGFVYAVKASRFLTHMKKLKDPEAGIEKFMERATVLGRKLGPILFQLPPFWERNVERLEGFLHALPRRRRYAFELRNPTWHHPDVYRVLERYNAAFCIYELSGFRSGIEVTADFTYVRLHGPGGPYQGSYAAGTLEDWAERVRRWSRELKAVYCYFDNDQAAYAVRNALTLKQLVSGRNRTAGGA
jgi:uncharacterized protein YecE (DUF72 family)